MKTKDIEQSTEFSPLDNIAAEEKQEFAEVEQQQEQAQQQQAEAEQENEAAGWLQAIEAAKELITSAFPEATSVWTKNRMQNLAEALARCDAVYGWGGVAGIFGHPLVGLAIAGAPLAIGTAKVINKEKAKTVDVEVNVVEPVDAAAQ